MSGRSILLSRRLRQQLQRLRLAIGKASAPRIREFYTSDFVILDGSICKVFWKVENAWRLTLGPVPVPGGYATLDVTGRIYADIVADARQHTLYLHAFGVNGQRVSQFLDIRPLPVQLRVPSPVLTHRSRPDLPLMAAEGLRLASAAWQPGPLLPAWQDLPEAEMELRLYPLYQPAARLQRRTGLPIPDLSGLPPIMAQITAWLGRLRQTATPNEARTLAGEVPPQ